MAKKVKKEKVLTIEEKLDKALVPDVEQPYKIPKNWCWVKLETLTSITAGGTPARNNQKFWDGGQIPWVKISDLSGKNLETTEEKITQLGLDNSSAKIFKKGTILYTIFATIGEVAVLNIDAATNQAIAGITCKETQSIDYMYYVLLVLKDLLVSKSKGVAQVNINQTILKETPIPLAPLAEQQRIVERIESFFAKLDEAKEKAQSIIDSFEDRKTAILHKAFTGELTAEWRLANKISETTWKNLTLNDIADYKKGPFGSSITKTMFVPKGEHTYKVYEQGNAIRKTIDYGSYYINEQKYNELKGFAVHAGDIIISCAGTIGEVYKLPRECEAGVINQALMRVRVYSNIKDRFFIYYFGEIIKGDIRDQANGTAIKNIPPFKVMKAMKIRLPSLIEQEIIIDLIDGILSKEKRAKVVAEQVIAQIDGIKKSILSRAFRGELGTNDPTDEPAIELLKRIL